MALSNSVVHMSGALYAAFEQVLLRFWMWNCPHEMFILSNQLIGKLFFLVDFTTVVVQGHGIIFFER